MSFRTFRTCATIALSFGAGVLLTTQWNRIQKVRAESTRVFELRIYHTNPGRLPALAARFRDHTDSLFKRHGLTSVGYFTPQDSPKSQNTFIYILAHDSRESATKRWAEFQADPEWKAVYKASEADGAILEGLESTFMVPTDFSAMK